MLAGCSKSDKIDSALLHKLYSPKFYVEFEGDATRTYLDENMHQYWNKADAISVFTSLNNQKYCFDGETGDNKGTFSAVSPEQNATGEVVYLKHNYALYPYSDMAAIATNGTIMFELPSQQQYAENTFAVGANPMVAVTSGLSDTNLLFQNLCGFLRLRLYGDDVTIRRIDLYSNYGEKISGKATVTAEYGKAPQIVMSEGDDSWGHITLYCGEQGVKIGATAEEATDFWFVVPPKILEGGFQLSVYDIDDGYAWKGRWERFEIERNVVKSMAPVEIIPNVLKAEKDTYYIGTEGGFIDMTIKLTGDISVEVPEEYKDWISYVDPTRATYNESIRIEVKPLTEGTEREGHIMVWSTLETGEGIGHGVYIRQTDEIVTVDKQINLDPWGGEFWFEIREDINFKITPPDAKWLRPVEDKELAKHQFRYQYDYNSTYEPREAKFLVTNLDNNKVDTLTVTQAQRDAIVLSQTRYSLNSKGGDIEIEVGHNIDFEIEISNDWITQKQTKTRAFTTDKLMFSIAPNPTFSPRKGTIKFIGEDLYGNPITQTVTIDQAMGNNFEPSVDDWGDDDEEYGGSAE